MNNRKWYPLVALLLVMVFVVSACDSPSGTAPSASSLLPNLGEYSVIEGTSIQDFLAGLGTAAGTLAANPAVIGVVNVVDRVGDCYRDVGAVDFRFYAKTAQPVVAGMVAVINRDQLTDPNTLMQCLGLAQSPSALAEGQGGGGLQACVHTYATRIEDDTFDIMYVGTDLEACQAFCGALPNCTGH